MLLTGSIRAIESRDAQAYRDFIVKLDCESKFLLFEPEERSDSTEFYQSLIDISSRDPNVKWLVVEYQNQIIGFMSAVRGQQNRIKHRVHIAMGVLAEFQRKGAARGLFDHLISWCRQVNIERIELTVVTTNTPAIALYNRMGFEIEGLRQRSLRIDGQWVDEYSMAKILSRAGN